MCAGVFDGLQLVRLRVGAEEQDTVQHENITLPMIFHFVGKSTTSSSSSDEASDNADKCEIAVNVSI